jgi:hypothetical protein
MKKGVLEVSKECHYLERDRLRLGSRNIKRLQVDECGMARVRLCLSVREKISARNKGIKECSLLTAT